MSTERSCILQWMEKRIVRQDGGTAHLAKTPGLSLHRQLYLVLRDRIVRGEWDVGDAIPAEEALCKLFSVSRITVRRALADLAQEGLVERRHGLGTFVLGGPACVRPQPTLSFLEGLKKTVLDTEVRVLHVERGIPPRDIARQLQLANDGEAVHALRLRSRGSTPLMVTDAWVPGHLGRRFTAASLRKRALYEILLDQGVKFGRVIQEISAEMADPEVAKLLQVPSGVPLLVLTRIIHDMTAHPVQHLRVTMSAERSRILMEIPGASINTLVAGQIVHDDSQPR